MSDAILFSLPAIPDGEQPEAHWWRIRDGAVAESGVGTEWLGHLAGQRGARPTRIALAPVAGVRLSFGEPAPAESTPRQAAAIARIAALETSLGDSKTLHLASSRPNGNGVPVMTAVADNGTMLAWLDWARALGADPDHIVPAGALLDWDEDWAEARIGSERMVGRRGTVLPSEPDLVARIVGDAQVRDVSDEEISSAIVAAAAAPPLDLRTGRFARRRTITIDRERIRWLAVLASLIPLITLAWAIAGIIRLDQSTNRLDGQTLAVAEAALGRPVSLEAAQAELRQRAGPASRSFSAPLAALYQRMEAVADVSATELAYRPDGTLVATLAAPSVDPINLLLVQIQRDGYAITAVPRQAPDGRATVDITVRGAL